MLCKANDELEWRSVVEAGEWDAALARLGGHPLQSALWGDARRHVDNIKDHRWMASRGNEAVCLARVEERNVPGIGRIGWAPRGPAGEDHIWGRLPKTFAKILSDCGISVLITDPWTQASSSAAAGRSNRVQTIWVDLSGGKERLWAALAKVRYGVGRAKRLGVTVEKSAKPTDLEQFYAICSEVSQAKGFQLSTSLPLMSFLIERGSGPVEAHLFVARKEGRVAGGAFILRCGRSIHYFWGGTDRHFLKERIGEVVQWGVLEWATAQGCTRYDLEGIDIERNAPVFAFKKKLGGEDITLTGKQYYPLDLRGHVLGWLDRLRN